MYIIFSYYILNIRIDKNNTSNKRERETILFLHLYDDDNNL